MTEFHTRWQMFEQLGVTAAEDDVIDHESAAQMNKNAGDILFPGFSPDVFKAGFADTIFNCAVT